MAHDFYKATFWFIICFWKTQMPCIQVLKGFHPKFFILFPLDKSHLALPVMGLHRSFPLQLLPEIACAFWSRPHHCSFPFSCIPCSQISLAAELVQNFNHIHNTMVTSIRNPSEGGCFASGQSGSPCQNTLSSSRHLWIENYSPFSFPLHRVEKLLQHPTVHVVHLGRGVLWDMGYISDPQKGRQESSGKFRKMCTWVRFARSFQTAPST